MNPIIHSTYSHPLSEASVRQSSWKKFMTWCESQEKNRFGWLAASLTIHGCVLTILTIFTVFLAGNPFIFWPFIIGAMGAVLVVNLAAMPTRITIPVFFLSVMIDLIIIASCLMMGLNSGKSLI